MNLRALAIAAVACQAHAGAPARPVTPPAKPIDQLGLTSLIGTWRWMLHTTDASSDRVEIESWSLGQDPTSETQLVGHYVREVEVRSVDRVPFQCDQRLWYRQRAVFDVVVEHDAAGFVVRETGVTVDPSPCDDGERELATYRAERAGTRLVLHWPSGQQTLWQVADRAEVAPPATPMTPAGPWRWEASRYDDQRTIRDEREWWEITQHSATQLDITYRRRVTVRTPDNSPIACAGAPTWSFDDAYVATAQLEADHWHLFELAVEPGDHPCLRATPERTLDEATAVQIGDYLVITWRGNRRQVLYRPDPVAGR